MRRMHTDEEIEELAQGVVDENGPIPWEDRTGDLDPFIVEGGYIKTATKNGMNYIQGRFILAENVSIASSLLSLTSKESVFFHAITLKSETITDIRLLAYRSDHPSHANTIVFYNPVDVGATVFISACWPA